MIFCKNKPKIRFHSTQELLDAFPHPVKASKAMPEWFKKLKPVAEDRQKIDSGTVKRCMPMLDAISQGYIIPLWADIQVKVDKYYHFKDEEGKVIHEEMTGDPDKYIDWTTPVTKEVVVSYEDTGELGVWVQLPEIEINGSKETIGSHTWAQVGNACDLKKFKLGKVLLKLTNPWIIETPKGWSVQIKNPANNWSNEINILEGVVDTDEYYSGINFPFVWTGNEIGEFVIPQGTPLIHVIPFKRTEMDLEVGLQDPIKSIKTGNKLKTKFYDRYKTHFWHKRRNKTN